VPDPSTGQNLGDPTLLDELEEVEFAQDFFEDKG